MPNPTIVLASLDDEKLRQSIANLVANVKRATHTMLTDTNSTVDEMEKKLKSLGNLKIGSGSTNDGGASKRTKAHNEETEAIEKNIAAQDRQIKKNQEAAMSFDRKANAQQVAIRSANPSGIRNADTLQTMNIQLDLLRERLREARQQYSSFVALAAHATTTGDKGLFQFATEGVHRYEQEVRNLIPQIRTLQSGIQQMGDVIAPQGHTIQNYVNSLQKANPELAALNAQYKSGTSLLQEQATSYASATQAAQHYTEEIRKQLAAITSKKDATKAFEQISLMPSNTMDEIKAKGQALVELVKKVKDTPLMSQSNVKLAEKMIGSLANQYRALKEEKEKVANTPTTNVVAENTTRRSLEQEKQDLERLKALQEERRQQIIQTGIAAQQQARILRESIGQQMQSADYTKQVDKVKELQNALTEMKNAYKQPIDSSIKKSLEEDIAITQKALDIAKRYNMTVAGLGAVGIGGKAPTDTLAAYSAEAQRLAGIYKNLSTEERSASAGQGLKRKYQELSHTASQVRKELERPINLKDAMKGGESTIDDLAYKIQRLQSYKRGLDFKTQAGEIQEVDNKIKSLNAELNKYLGTTKNVQSQNTALGRSWNYMKNRLAFYFTVGASTQFVKNLIEVRSQYEMNERALGILINSAERGTQIFNELSQMALVSPYTLIELSAAAKQLTAYDIAARDVVDTTRRLADMASAVGVPIERLTYALGQIKAYGYLNSRDQRMFANAGIPLAGELAKYYTEIEGRLVSTGDVYDRIKKKAVDYNTVMQVMYRMTDEGGKFFDFQAKMADTLKVRLANLTLAWNNMLNDIGKESQGVLTWGIGALRTLFLHWKELDKLIKNVAWIVGIRTAFMLLTYGVLKLGGALGYTSKQMALSAVFGNRLAGVLRTVGGAMKTLAMSKVTWFLVLAEAVWEAGNMIFRANQATVELNKSLREGAETNFKDISEYLGQYQKVADSLYKKKDNDYAYNYDIRTRKLESEAGTPTNINVDEANKAWEAMRERIELSTAASDDFVGRLLTIENVSERLRQGFILLNDIQQVNSAMKEMGDTAIVVTQDWSKWWNLWIGTDGLIDNLGDVQDELDDVVKKFGSLEEARKQATGTNEAWQEVSDYDNAMRTLKGDIDETTESLNNFIRNMGFASNPDQIAEVYAQALQKISAEGNLDPQRGYMLQKGFEDARGKAMKEALEARIADEEHALKLAHDYETKESLSASIQRHEAQLELFTKYTNDQRTEWERFTKYMKENHISEMQAMFGQMDEEQISHINWQEGKYLDFVKRTAAAYAKRHNMAYEDVFNRLWGLIHQTNLMQIFLKLTISTEGQKSITDLLVEYDQQADAALTKIQRNQRRLQEMRDMGWDASISKYHKEYLQLKKETDDLIASYDDVTSKEKGGHAKQADKANEKAAKAAAAARKKEAAAAAKAERQAESELAKALGNEIQLINEAKSEYKKLEDAGYETFSALEIIQKRFSQSVKNINTVLAKNNIPLFDLSRFTGASNPRFLLNMLEEQIKALKNNPRVKAAETQKFEIEFSKVDIDAKAFDSKKIAEGLDNSLSRLKDEYELAIALDADPELGNLFADWMGIDTSVLPRTVQEYAERATKYLNQYLKENKAELTIPDILNLTSDDMRAFEEGTKTGLYNKEWVERIKKTYEEAANYRKKDMEETIKGWNSLLEKYSDYQHRLVLVQKNASQERLSLIRKFGSEDEKSQGIQLLDAIKVENNPEEVAKLVAQLKDLAEKVSQNDETAIKLNVAIDQKALEETSKITFEEFQKTPQWMMATSDLASMTDNMIKMLIQDLEKFKRVNKKALSTKDLRKLQKTLNSLHRQARRGNPFHAIADAMDEAKERASEYDDKIAETEKKLAEYGKLGRELTEEEVQEVERLREEYKRLKQEKQEASKPNAEKIVDSIKEAIGVAQEAIGMFSQMAEAIGGKGMTDAAKNLNKVVGVLQMAAEGAAIGAKFSTTGAAIGAVAGGLTGVITQFADELSGNARINRAIKRSELAVKRLELAYIDLEEAENKAYGTAVVGAKQAVRANKELQLAELRRQLVLEQSRKKKNRDENRILELKQQIKELQYEIKNASVDIINELFGQQSAGDFAEQLVSNMIDAFRQGEDYMKSFYDSFDEMVDNMIMKSITSRVVADYIDAVWEDMEDRITKRSDDEAKAYADAQLDVSNYEAFTDKDAAEKQRKVFADFWNSLTKEEMEAYYKQYYKGGKIAISTYFDKYPKVESPIIGSPLSLTPWIAMQQLPELFQKVWDDYTNNLYATEKSAKKALDKATAITDYDINYIMDKFSETLPELGEQLKTLIGQYYNIGDKSEKQLSALQQGIQGVTEDTAGAIEAYLNGMSQQAYLRNDLLTQIRDAVVTMDVDVQTGVQAQMLLQLQQSYAVQMAIQGILEGWNNPSGQAVRVELVS